MILKKKHMLCAVFVCTVSLRGTPSRDWNNDDYWILVLVSRIDDWFYICRSIVV